MSMVIANNMQAINTKRQFATSSRGMSSAMEKLSSGYKINTGKDDPSGLLISEKLRSQINGLKRAQQNTEEAINVMGIAEGALNEMNSILKKMKALAIHSNNTGVTSPDQIAADQAEMDSAIQTLDRIAQTTKFSDENLLNGSKDIAYKQDTLIKGTQQNSLLNVRESNFSQIFKRDNYSVSINYTGTTNADSVTGIGNVDFTQQTMRAYLEVDTAKTGADGKANLTQVKNGAFTQEQAFTLTGSKGSRSFKFKQGALVTDMVAQIKSVADSTGIDAALVFNSDQKIDKMASSAENNATDGVFSSAVKMEGFKTAGGEDVGVMFKGTNTSELEALQKALDKAGVSLSFKLEPGTGMTEADADQGKYALTISDSKGNTATLGADWDMATDPAQVLTGLTFTDKSASITWDADVKTALAALSVTTDAKIDFVDTFVDDLKLAAFTTAAVTIDKIYGGGAGDGKISVDFSGFDYDTATAGLSDEIKAKLLNDAGSLQYKVELTNINGTTADKSAYGIKLSILDANGESIISQNIGNGQLNLNTNGGTTATVTLTGVMDGVTIAITPDATNYPTLASMTAPTPATGAHTGGALDTFVPPAMSATGDITSVLAAKRSQVGGAATDISAARQTGNVAVFNNTIASGSGDVTKGVSGVTIGTNGAGSIQYGMNTDGQGRIYVKFLDDNSFELYKDSSLSAESKVASGVSGQEIKEANNSGLKGLTLNLAGTDLAGKKGVYMSFAGVEGVSETVNGTDKTNGVMYNGDVIGNGTSQSATFNKDLTTITGVELGTNTSAEGQIYLKNVYTMDDKTGQATVQVFAYKHKDMKDEDMVAKSEVYNTKLPDATDPSKMVDAKSLTVVLNEVRNADNTAGTGLGIVLSMDADAFSSQKKSATMTGDISFTNLGARIFSQDYGSDATLKVTQDKGAIFTEYGTAGDNSSARLIDAGEKGTIVEKKGQDATISVNGMEIKTQGLQIKMATQDIQADFTFNQGKVGSTTLAQVGYGEGSIFTKIGALNLGSSKAETTGKYEGLSGLLANAGHVTNENIGDFQGGMQLQLGEGAGDQNRTVVAIKDMTSGNLGRVTKGGYWETGSAVYTERTFTMKDVMGGGMASLSVDATLSMSIIDQAINDVSETRALIGATQANMLQTNSNNLSVTLENITKTESGIRDADMADEMTEFTKQQVLQNAAMSMMSQANQASQNVLQLLR